MKMQVFVRLKSGVLDVQGKAVEKGLHDIGFSEIGNLRVGKLIEFDIEETDPNKAKVRIKEMCDKLLANTVIESYEIKPL